MRYIKYLRYLVLHKYYVFIESIKLGIPIRGFFHDMEKFLPREFIGYAKHFYDKSGNIKIGMDILYNGLPRDHEIKFLRWYRHHVTQNKHHWQFWVITDNTGKHYILPIDLDTRKEMLADWKSVSKVLKQPDIKKWYIEHQDKVILDDESKEWFLNNI